MDTASKPMVDLLSQMLSQELTISSTATKQETLSTIDPAEALTLYHMPSFPSRPSENPERLDTLDDLLQRAKRQGVANPGLDLMSRVAAHVQTIWDTKAQTHTYTRSNAEFEGEEEEDTRFDPFWTKVEQLLISEDCLKLSAVDFNTVLKDMCTHEGETASMIDLAYEESYYDLFAQCLSPDEDNAKNLKEKEPMRYSLQIVTSNSSLMKLEFEHQRPNNCEVSPVSVGIGKGRPTFTLLREGGLPPVGAIFAEVNQRKVYAEQQSLDEILDKVFWSLSGDQEVWTVPPKSAAHGQSQTILADFFESFDDQNSSEPTVVFP